MKQNKSSRVQHQVDTKGEGGGAFIAANTDTDRTGVVPTIKDQLIGTQYQTILFLIMV